MKSPLAYVGIAVAIAAFIWVATAKGGGTMETITQAVQTVESAQSSDAERAALTQLSSELAGKSFRLMAVLADNSERNFRDVTDPSGVQTLRLIVNDAGSEIRHGPWAPQDPNNYYALFLE